MRKIKKMPLLSAVQFVDMKCRLGISVAVLNSRTEQTSGSTSFERSLYFFGSDKMGDRSNTTQLFSRGRNETKVNCETAVEGHTRP